MALKDLKGGNVITNTNPELIDDYPTARYLITRAIVKSKPFQWVTSGKKYIYLSLQSQFGGSNPVGDEDPLSIDEVNFAHLYSCYGMSNEIQQSYCAYDQFVMMACRTLGISDVTINTVTKPHPSMPIPSSAHLSADYGIRDITVSINHNNRKSASSFNVTTEKDYKEKGYICFAKALAGLYTVSPQMIQEDLKKKQEKEMKELIDRYTF